MTSLGLFLAGLFCGVLLTLSVRAMCRWLSIRVLPARYLQTHSVRRRKASTLKEVTRGE